MPSSPVIFSKLIGGAMYDLVALFVIVLVASLPVLLTMSTYYCGNDRSRLSEAVFEIYPLQMEIEVSAKKTGALANAGAGLAVEATRNTKGGLVSKDGTIISITEKPAAAIMLVPSYSDGVVTWKCHGFPSDSMPAHCRAHR